jgi:hypothetical protein
MALPRGFFYVPGFSALEPCYLTTWICILFEPLLTVLRIAGMTIHPAITSMAKH